MQGVFKKREYGIDLLRIVSMMMVVLLHICLAGGILETTSGMSHKVILFIVILSYCAVNCFALVSGYVGYNSKNKLSSIFELWLQVFLYNFIIDLIFILFGKIEFSFTLLKEMLFPILSNRYWYFTAYFGLFIFRPILNFILNDFTTKQLKYSLIGGFILFSICPLFFDNPVFFLGNGYSIWWLMYLYLLGGYIKKNNLFKEFSKSRLMLIYFGVCVFSFLFKYGCLFLGQFNGEFIQYSDKFINYTSPTIVIAAIALVVFFSKIKVEKIKKAIFLFTPMVFGVYLIHTHSLIYGEVLTGVFKFISNYSFMVILGFVLGSTLLIYLICSFIDYGRIKLFKLFKVKEYFNKIEKKITKYL